MKEFDYHGQSKVRGAVLKAYLQAFGPYKKRGEQVLCKHLGVDELLDSQDALYSLPDFFMALEEFQIQFGKGFMHKIGQGIFANAAFPPSLDTVEKAMSSINEAYYMNHQTPPGDIGGYHWEKVSDNEGIMVCDNPYPCGFDQGLIETIAGTFAQNVQVTHADDGQCRHEGGEQCTYHVKWENK